MCTLSTPAPSSWQSSTTMCTSSALSPSSWQSMVMQHDSTTGHYDVFVVLDTACQRSVAPRVLLAQVPNAYITVAPESERFKFGVGHSLSEHRACILVQCLGKNHDNNDNDPNYDASQPDFALHFSQVGTDIPFLLSRPAMQSLGAVLALSEETCTLSNLPGKPKLPLRRVLGHLGLLLRLCAHSVIPAPKTDVTMVPHIQHVLVAYRLDELPAMLPAVVSDELKQAIQRLLQRSLPLASQRTNLLDDGRPPPRSLTLGAYTQRGHGVTAATEKELDMLADALAVARSRPPRMRMPFLSITLTVGAVQEHNDNNFGLSTTMAFGDYTGGKLIIDNIEFANNMHWVLFDGLCKHKVSQVSGHRMSITLYTPPHPGKLSTEHVNRLSELGFPVEQWIKLRGWHAIKRSAVLPPSAATAQSANSADALGALTQPFQTSQATHPIHTSHATSSSMATPGGWCWSCSTSSSASIAWRGRWRSGRQDAHSSIG
eukprot:1392791-Amphidinium_carterae.3